MDPTLANEKKKYDLLWENVPSYRSCSPGEMQSDHFLSYFSEQLKADQTIIDFGCGTGRAAKRFLEMELLTILVDFSPNCLDPEISLLLLLASDRMQFIEACLWDLPTELHNAEWLYCCDVLEHIPEDKIEKVLEGMAARNLIGGYASICLIEDNFGSEIFKEPLHLCLKDTKWWIEKLSKHWKVISASCDEEYFNCYLIKHESKK